MKKSRNWRFVLQKNKPQGLLKTLKLIFFLNVCMVTFLSATAVSQQRLTIKLGETGLKRLFEEIHRQTQKTILYNDDRLALDRKIKADFTDVTLEELLQQVLKNSDMTYQFVDDYIVIVPRAEEKAAPEAQTKKVQGIVVDREGLPLPGVTVVVKGTRWGTATDSEGKFQLEIPDMKDLTLLFSFVGMKNQEVKVGQKHNFRIIMESSEEKLDEVVVTGIFRRNKEGFTGSATKVSGDDIKRMTSGNVLKALEILDPGFRMNVSNVSGSNPNAVPDFQMRGQANMGDYEGEDFVMLRGDYNTRPNQPLFVLDGIIGVDVTTIMDLDPEQVESITLLKDAAATVIYGSEAANGVVVVETKAPVAGKLRFTYNGNYKIQIPDLRDYNLMNSREKLELEERAGYYDFPDNLDLIHYYNQLKLEVLRGVNTYWLSKPLRTAFAHRHGLNAEGGDRALRYKIYLGINLSPGVMKQSDLTTKSGKIDIQYRFGKFLISNQLYVDYSSGARTSPYGSFREYTLINPYYRAYDENGNIKKILDNNDVNGYGINILNPLYNTLFDSKDESHNFSLKEALKVEYLPWENLRLSLDFNITRNDGKVEMFKPAQHTSFDRERDPTKRGSYSSQKSDGYNYRLSVSGAYNKAFRQDHLLSVFARYTIDESANDMTILEMTGFPNDKLSEVYLGTTYRNISGSEGVSRSLGFLFTLNYSYKQRYAVDYSMRIDASSQFGRNNRFAPFWSAGLRWNLDKESFIKKLNIFDELIVRGTYGITGSQGFTPYQSLQMYSYSGLMQTYKSSDVVGTALMGIGNPELKWQQTANWNVSLDFSVLKNLISARLEYYDKNTKNTLLDYSLAPSVGFSSMKENLGRITNRGIEATLRLRPYSNPAKQAYWNIVFSGAKNKSKIVQISNALKAQNEKYMSDITDRPLPRYENGYSQSIIWAVRSLGIDPMSGREIFLTRDGRMTTTWNAKDEVPVGDTEPKFAGSISTTFNYKGFSLSIAGRYKWGGQKYNATLIEKIENINMRQNVDRRALTERWKEPGDLAFFKAISKDAYRNGTKASSRFVMDDNEFAISTINFSYRFERKDHPWLSRAGITSASLGLYWEDVARFSTIKMERGTAYPFSHQASMSLNIIF